METLTLEGLFEWDQEARDKKKEKNEEKRKAKKAAKTHVIEVVENTPKENDKAQDKLDLALESNPEETIGGLVDNWKPYPLEGYATPKFDVPVKKSNNYEFYKKQELSKVLAFIEYAQRKRLINTLADK